MIKKQNNEDILSYAQRLLDEDNAYDIGLMEQYKLLFNEPVSYDNAQRQLKGIKKFLNLIKQNKSESITNNEGQIDLTINKDGTQTRNALLVLSEEEIKTPELLLTAHGYDPKIFDLVSAKNSMWHQKSNTYGLSTLYCSKITVKPKTEISIEEIKEIFNTMDREYCNNSKNYLQDIKYSGNKLQNDENVLIINFFDVHFSKLAHKEETGMEYNYKIAEQIIIDNIMKYINRFKDRSFEYIYFAIGQDFFNSEADGMTNKNTKQDNDLRYSEMFKKGVNILITVIDLLKEAFHCKIYVPLVQGNHSTYVEFYAAQYLYAWYRKDDQVEIDAEPTPRKYYKYGVNLFGFTHNSEEKDRLYNLMQIEEPQKWADTIERTWFTGHLHCEDVKDKAGVFIRQAPTLCGIDAWHKRMGFVGSIRRTQAFIYNKEDGLVETHYAIVK